MKMVMVVALMAMAVFALGGTALADPPNEFGEVGQNGPTPPRLGDPVAVQSEVQWVTISGVTTGTTGTFDLCNGSTCTAQLSYRATASQVQGALAGTGLPFASGTVSVVGGPSSANYSAADPTAPPAGTWYYRIMWVGALAGTDIPTLQYSAETVNPGAVAIQDYRQGATVAGQISPHGGYSGATDYCLQCHQVHDAPGQYSLLAQTSVTATCETCHSLYGVAKPVTAPDPGFDPMVEGTTSERAAYEVTGTELLGGHEIGWEASTTEPTIPYGSITVITESGWAYRGTPATFNQAAPAEPGTASETAGGLYCGSCHTPHGEFGQLINSFQYRTGANEDPTHTTGTGSLLDVTAWANGNPFFSGGSLRYLWYDTDPTATTPEPGVWLACTATPASDPAGSLPTGCSYLTATDTEGESAYLYGYKLLSAYPNHSWRGGGAAVNVQGVAAGPESWGMDYQTHDQQRWCGRCHDLTVDGAYGGPSHTHGTACTACHGNPNDGTSTDFPHTSTFDRLLKDYPDLLCITCHNGPTSSPTSPGQITAPGSLP